AGFQIDSNNTFSKQPVAGPMTAINISRRQFDRKIDQSEFFIHTDLPPYAGVAHVVGGLVEPRITAKLAGLWNGVENPQTFAGAHIESADLSFCVVLDAG